MKLFCKHEWEFIDEIPYKIKRVYICKKCLKKKEIKF